jgi:hypothetical protein
MEKMLVLAEFFLILTLLYRLSEKRSALSGEFEDLGACLSGTLDIPPLSSYKSSVRDIEDLGPIFRSSMSSVLAILEAELPAPKAEALDEEIEASTSDSLRALPVQPRRPDLEKIRAAAQRSAMATLNVSGLRSNG